MTRNCTICKKIKSLEDFPKDPKMTLGRGSWCRQCLREHKRAHYHANIEKERARITAWQKANPEKIKAGVEKAKRDKPEMFKGKILQKYWPGSTWREALLKFNDLMAKQNKVCAICEMPETKKYARGNKDKVQDLCVDHCHTTGRVRGLLCDSCNRLIGGAKNSPIICIAASGYLKRSINDAIS